MQVGKSQGGAGFRLRKRMEEILSFFFFLALVLIFALFSISLPSFCFMRISNISESV